MSDSPTPRTGAPESDRAQTARWQAFAICLGAGFMTLLDVTIVNVALPSIETSLHATPSQLQLVLAGYTLAFGLALVPAGRLGDVYGRRTLFLVGLTSFVVASALCGLVTSADWLAIARFAQGLAAGILNPQVIGFIQDLFRGPERGRAFGYFGATIGIATATGPLVGGLLLAAFGTEEGWRAVFLVNVPIGLVLLPLAWKLLPRRERTGARVRLDVLGSVLLALAVVAIMWPFVSSTSEGGASDGAGGEAAGSGSGAAVPWWTIAVGLALVGVLVWWERRVSARGGLPLIPGSLLRLPSFTFGTAVSTMYFLSFTGIWLSSTLYLQQGLGLSPLQAGLVLTPFSIAGAYSASLGGRLISRFGRPLVVVGIAIGVVAMVALDILTGLVGFPAIVFVSSGVLVIAGFGNGFVISPNQTLTLAEVPPRDAGSAAGALQTMQRLGAAIGVSANAAVFFVSLEESGGDYTHAFDMSLRLVAGIMALALVVALADWWRLRHRAHEDATESA
ncbi:MFS transporter [Serinibacter salmoneus]|uniref:EmrB/QacA subfamily drug resistance transporter n=1 Tax=Serinibacter salmoneus TaxID=556530 RepID=A0A2A9CWI6_9MICO|nr:MFS transporter [Serinibacter salmoneus]PFG18797.1 EmrB/QacA subfamily drug resistance transporter [Serinibacter salmoneus]